MAELFCPGYDFGFVCWRIQPKPAESVNFDHGKDGRLRKSVAIQGNCDSGVFFAAG